MMISVQQRSPYLRKSLRRWLPRCKQVRAGWQITQTLHSGVQAESQHMQLSMTNLSALVTALYLPLVQRMVPQQQALARQLQQAQAALTKQLQPRP